MALGSDPTIATQGAAGGAVGQVSRGPHIVQIHAADDVGYREDWPPRRTLVVGEVDRIGGTVHPLEVHCSGHFIADGVAWAAELPGIHHIADHLLFVGVAGAGVDLDSSVLIPGGGHSAEAGDVHLPPVGFIAPGDFACVVIGIQEHRQSHLAQVVVAGRLAALFLRLGQGWQEHARQDGDDGDDHQ